MFVKCNYIFPLKNLDFIKHLATASNRPFSIKDDIETIHQLNIQHILPNYRR